MGDYPRPATIRVYILNYILFLQLVKQDSLGNQSTAPAVESSEDSSSDSSDSDSSSTSDESDDSPTKVSDVNSLPQPISSQSSTGMLHYYKETTDIIGEIVVQSHQFLI